MHETGVLWLEEKTAFLLFQNKRKKKHTKFIT